MGRGNWVSHQEMKVKSVAIKLSCQFGLQLTVCTMTLALQLLALSFYPCDSISGLYICSMDTPIFRTISTKMAQFMDLGVELIPFVCAAVQRIKQEPCQSPKLASQLQSLNGLCDDPERYVELLSTILQCGCILNKLCPKFNELAPWILSYYQCIQEHFSDDRIPDKEIVMRQLIQISMKVTMNNGSNVFYMHFLGAKKKNGWDKQFCEEWAKLKKQLKEQQAAHQITLQVLINQEVNKRMAQHRQPTNNCPIVEVEHKQSIGPDQMRVANTTKPDLMAYSQKMRRDIISEERYLNRISAMSERLQSKYLFDQHKSGENIVSLCRFLLSRVDLFMAETIQKVVKRAKICNENLDSQSFGDEFRYFSPTGYSRNSRWACRKYQHLLTAPKKTTLYKLAYPSKLQILNFTQAKESEEELALLQILRSKESKGLGLYYDGLKLEIGKKTIKPYLLTESEVEKPVRKTEAEAQRKKKRVVIKHKFVSDLLFCDPAYSCLYPYEKIFM